MLVASCLAFGQKSVNPGKDKDNDVTSEDAVAGGLLARAQLNLPLDEASRAAKRYISLSADDVRLAFAKWIRPDGFVQVVRGPAPQ